ncbi:hypothetical protein L2E82_33895 [Cichorium intybus]|uniref:Uncharacterized protein n=1 Tax=Cichorium intybus TaxID=13427 RepID=A0ACB9BLB8_CICIN|nr:hypothetical protein L2E82_33895 [Cichorium intybus]
MRKSHVFDDVEVASQKQRADNDICLLESSKAKTNTRNEKLKPKMDQKPDYIHVRARRGQATDNHSIAERARREKLKKKMQVLQDMVPGCKKLTNKAAILDEIISYVHCLQMEVEHFTKPYFHLNTDFHKSFLQCNLLPQPQVLDFKMDNSLPKQAE